jgi:hypothetical protein
MNVLDDLPPGSRLYLPETLPTTLGVTKSASGNTIRQNLQRRHRSLA